MDQFKKGVQHPHLIMEVGLNNHLRKIASRLILKKGSLEKINLIRSIESLQKKLFSHFKSKIDRIIIFGSYSRGTMLPRDYDKDGDVDILIFFNTEETKLQPDAYRRKLQRFAELNYSKAQIVKDHPSIVVKQSHTNFDLVPTIFDSGIVYDSIEIPGKEYDWIETSPHKFNEDLVKSNTYNYSQVKPVIRLLKYWNASQGRPYSSYQLEQIIIEMNFNNDKLDDCFYNAIRQLDVSDLSNVGKAKVKTLHNNIDWIETYLNREDLAKAKQTLHRILPKLY